MATETGSTYVFESMTDIIKNSIGKLEVLDHDEIDQSRLSVSDSNMTDNWKWTPKPEIHISETMRDSIEILTASMGFMTMQNS